jgi:flagellar basal-body rod protein FlgC
VVFQTVLMGARGQPEGAAGVKVSTVREDDTPGRRVHDPKHPSADGDGYVTYSNVNAVEEMVNMISASRSYQNSVEVMNTATQPAAEDAADGSADLIDPQEGKPR